MKTPRFWQDKNPISLALLPLSFLYRLGAWVDRNCSTAHHAPLPVIAVGNVTAGGAGKTPACLALVPLLAGIGCTPHILTRGYRAAGKLRAHLINPQDDWRNVGDEALLLAESAPTWVGADRLASAQAAAAAGASVLVCDDALQHHALHKDISLLVIDGPYGVGNGMILPAGSLREPLSAAIARADALLIIGDDTQCLATHLSIPVFRATLRPLGDTSFLATGRWLAFAGIGRPEKFYASLRQLGAELVTSCDFPDHHAYRADELAELAARAAALDCQLITTAKDAIKLPPVCRQSVRVLPVELTLDDPDLFVDFLLERLAATANSA